MARIQVHRFRSRKVALLTALICVVLIVAGLEATNTTHFFHKDKRAEKIIKTVGKTTQAPVQNVSATQPAPEKKPATSADLGNGHAVDTNGQATANTDPSQWVTSQSGEITVKQPVANAKLTSGSTISGSAKVDMVHYRLIDSTTGKVAEGVLSVVNGNFSGTLQFQHTATNGRLDIFSTEADGTEINEVQIGVSF